MQMSQSPLNTPLKFSLKDMTVTRECKSTVFCTLSRAEIRTRKLGIDRLAFTNSFTSLKPLSGKRLHLTWGQFLQKAQRHTTPCTEPCSGQQNPLLEMLSSCTTAFNIKIFRAFFFLLKLGPQTTYTHAASYGRALQMIEWQYMVMKQLQIFSSYLSS